MPLDLFFSFSLMLIFIFTFMFTGEDSQGHSLLLL